MSRYDVKYWDASVGIHMPVLDPGELYGCEITDSETGLIGTTHRARSSKPKAYEDAWDDLMQKQKVYYEKPKPNYSETIIKSTLSDNSDVPTTIGKLIGYGLLIALVVFVVIWLAVNVVIPIVLLNSALVLTVLAVIFKKQRRIFAILAFVGAIYMILDIHSGWFSVNFVEKVVKNPGWISAFVYINAAAVGLCTWFLIQPIWLNAKKIAADDKRKSIISMVVSVLLFAIATSLAPIIYHTVNNPFLNKSFDSKIVRSDFKMRNKIDSLSYAFGTVNYNALKRDSLNVNPMIVGLAMFDKEMGVATMTDEVARSFIAAYTKKRLPGKTEKSTGIQNRTNETYAEKNISFLEQNKSRANVKVTQSGLQYEVIKMGTGTKPTAQSIVKVDYVGTLIDGTEFDSSIKRNEPATFPVSGVIPGWTEALQLMPVGSKFKIVLPQSLAYGATSAGDVIKPYSTLIFEVELLEIIK